MKVITDSLTLVFLLLSIPLVCASDVIKGVAYIGSTEQRCRGVNVTLTKDGKAIVPTIPTAQDGTYEFTNISPGFYQLQYAKTAHIVVTATFDFRTEEGETKAPPVHVYEDANDLQPQQLQDILKERAKAANNPALVNADLQALKEAGVDSRLLAQTAHAFDATPADIPVIGDERLKQALRSGVVVVVKGNELTTLSHGGHSSNIIPYPYPYDLATALPGDKSVLIIATPSNSSTWTSVPIARAAKDLGYDNVMQYKGSIERIQAKAVPSF